MTTVLNSTRKGPEPGTANQVVIFVHGYGANGADLLGLADALSEHLPGTAFYAPDAPEVSTGNPMGFQWFPIPWLDGSSEEAAAQGMENATADLDAYVDQVLKDENLPADRLFLFGFSQGTMMSLHVAPRRSEEMAGIVGFSGRLLEPDLLADAAISKPPVLLVHGDQDDMVPPASLPEAANALQAAGFDVFAHVMKGTGHGIAPDGLSVALAFMRDRFGLE